MESDKEEKKRKANEDLEEDTLTSKRSRKDDEHAKVIVLQIF